MTAEDRLAYLSDIRARISRMEEDLADLREERLAVARTLRDTDGVSMTAIAAASGISDSRLARRLIATGSPRRTTHHWKG